VSEGKQSRWLALLQARVALSCLEIAVTIMDGDEALSRIARDLDDWIDGETRRLDYVYKE